MKPVAVIGGYARNGASAGAFYWAVDIVSGNLTRHVGARVAENGEWHIDPHYCKLA
jgi:hypothetical protein